ncbi:MAG: hypothetical protein M3Z33_01490 [Actinomycetota bacterium]|nr:hypothetical protein [Actinomycetota bacterium]
MAARAVTYLQERRRSAPVLRSLLRRANRALRQDDTRVHHFVPGIAIAFSAGAAAILTRTQDAELRYSVPFGIGAALTLDELALLVDVDNPPLGEPARGADQGGGYEHRRGSPGGTLCVARPA